MEEYKSKLKSLEKSAAKNLLKINEELETKFKLVMAENKKLEKTVKQLKKEYEEYRKKYKYSAERIENLKDIVVENVKLKASSKSMNKSTSKISQSKSLAKNPSYTDLSSILKPQSKAFLFKGMTERRGKSSSREILSRNGHSKKGTTLTGKMKSREKSAEPIKMSEKAKKQMRNNSFRQPMLKKQNSQDAFSKLMARKV